MGVGVVMQGIIKAGAFHKREISGCGISYMLGKRLPYLHAYTRFLSALVVT